MYRLTIQRVSHLVCRRSTVIYKDVFSGDELLTDAFDIKVVDDFFLEVDGKMISVGGEDIDIGGNASAKRVDRSVLDASIASTCELR